jgi:hypothetical protein
MNSIIDRDVVIDRGCPFDPEPDGDLDAQSLGELPTPCGMAGSTKLATKLATKKIHTQNPEAPDYYDTNLKRMIQHGEVDFKGFKPDEYKLYFLAKVKIVPGAVITFASWWGIGENLTNYYPEGDADREFEIWASLKFIGPKFGSETKDGKNRMVCDRLFLVDKNGKKYKGETE